MEIAAVTIIALLIISIEMLIYKKRILPGILYDCSFNKEEVFEGETVEIIETVVNPASMLIPCIKSEVTTSNYIEFANKESTVNDKNHSQASLFTVHGKSKVVRSWRAVCRRRGCYRLEDTAIIGSDFFGTCTYSTMKKLNGQLIVLPASIDVENILRNLDEQQGTRQMRKRLLEDPFIIAGTREYTSRDPMNHIHWGITASQGRLMVRNNESSMQRELTVIVNMQAYTGQDRGNSKDERIEWAIRIAAGELNKTLTDSVPVKLMVNGSDVGQENPVISGLMWGKAHIHELLVMLACLKEEYCQNFDSFLELYKREMTTSEMILITCYLTEQTAAFIKEKQHQGVKVKVYLLADEEETDFYEGINTYYLLPYLREAGDKNAG